MVGARNGDQPSLGKIAGGGRLGRIVDQPVLGGRKYLHRDRDGAQALCVGEKGRGAEREVQPAPGRAADRQVRIGAHLGAIPGEPTRVMGQHIVVESIVKRLADLTQHIAASAAEGQIEPHQGQGAHGRDLAELQAQHRRRQHGAGESSLAVGQRQQRQAPAHGMSDRHPRPGHAGFIGVEQPTEVFKERLVALGVALQPIREIAGRQPLTPPVVRQDHESTVHEIADGLEVLLDRLGAAPREHDCSAGPASRREQRRAQLRAARADIPIRLRPGRNRIVRSVDKERSLKHAEPGRPSRRGPESAAAG